MPAVRMLWLERCHQIRRILAVTTIVDSALICVATDAQRCGMKLNSSLEKKVSQDWKPSILLVLHPLFPELNHLDLQRVVRPW